MTYKERMKAVCEECGQPETCGYVCRGLQNKCDYLQCIMTGWELGQQDTLDFVESCIARGNSTIGEFISDLGRILEELEDGSRESV